MTECYFIWVFVTDKIGVIDWTMYDPADEWQTELAPEQVPIVDFIRDDRMTRLLYFMRIVPSLILD
jgi:hypothetical protein